MREKGIPMVSEFHINDDAYKRHCGFAMLQGLVVAHLKRLHNRGRMTLVPARRLGLALKRLG